MEGTAGSKPPSERHPLRVSAKKKLTKKASSTDAKQLSGRTSQEEDMIPSKVHQRKALLHSILIEVNSFTVVVAVKVLPSDGLS